MITNEIFRRVSPNKQTMRQYLETLPFGKDILVSGADNLKMVNKFTNESSLTTLNNLK